MRGYFDFFSDELASELVERFARTKRGKTTRAKGIHLLQRKLNITDKGILKLLEDIPLFETNSQFVP